LTDEAPQVASADRTGDDIMAALEKGITRNGTGYSGKTWNILGQVYFPKAVTDSTFAFETNSDPGQFVPVHIHPTQDEFILVQDGTLDLKLDGVWVKAVAGDLVRLPRGIPHGYFNKSDKPARALFWVSPTTRSRRRRFWRPTEFTFYVKQSWPVAKQVRFQYRACMSAWGTSFRLAPQ
jgi:quercetin dioxygenase-like cupin family protein